ncbi:RNA-directed DNA polymerase, eukaryota, partial [Tanacetum coccineum]
MMRMLTGEAPHTELMFEPRSVTTITDQIVIVEGYEGANVYRVHVWDLKDGLITRLTPQLHESAGGLPSILLVLIFVRLSPIFFENGGFPRGCNASFIALIPKVLDAKFVSDFGPISLIGSVYKVITKILANRLSVVISDLVSNTQTAFVKNRQILDGPFILSEALACANSKRNKPFLILDGVLGFGEFLALTWHPSWLMGAPLLASGLKINLLKSQVMGIGVPTDVVTHGAASIGCTVMNTPFKYLGITVGDNMSRHSAWSIVMQKIRSRLSSWKAKTLSIGGRLTLLKAVLGAVPLYFMSIYKAPKGVLHEMERIHHPLCTRCGTELRVNNGRLLALYNSVSLSPLDDRWYCDLNGEGLFRVKDIRLAIDEMFLPGLNEVTRWVNFVPIK